MAVEADGPSSNEQSGRPAQFEAHRCRNRSRSSRRPGRIARTPGAARPSCTRGSSGGRRAPRPSRRESWLTRPGKKLQASIKRRCDRRHARAAPCSPGPARKCRRTSARQDHDRQARTAARPRPTSRRSASVSKPLRREARERQAASPSSQPPGPGRTRNPGRRIRSETRARRARGSGGASPPPGPQDARPRVASPTATNAPG